MKLIAHMTEKSMKLTAVRGFTFIVPVSMDKNQIKKMIEKIYGVTVISVKTVNAAMRSKKNARGKVQKVRAVKKAVVYLKEGDKISLFEEEKAKKTKAKTKKETKNK
jgi:large subunit ribosomal protein L23